MRNKPAENVKGMQNVPGPDKLTAYQVPSEWTQEKDPGGIMVFAPLEPGSPFNTNVTMSVDPANGSNQTEFIKSLMTQLKAQFKGFREVRRRDFQTSSGVKGLRVETEHDQDFGRLQQIIYIYSTPENHYTLIYSALAKEASGKTADNIAKTLTIQGAQGEPKNMQTIKAEDGSFTVSVPKDWELKTYEGDNYPMGFAPLTEGKNFRTNLNIVTEPWDDNMNAYLRLAIPKLFEQFPQAKERSRKDFQTANGTKGIRLEIDNVVQNVSLRQVFYTFIHDGQALIFCYSFLPEEAKKFSALGDVIGKTVTLPEVRR